MTMEVNKVVNVESGGFNVVRGDVDVSEVWQDFLATIVRGLDVLEQGKRRQSDFVVFKLLLLCLNGFFDNLENILGNFIFLGDSNDNPIIKLIINFS